MNGDGRIELLAIRNECSLNRRMLGQFIRESLWLNFWKEIFERTRAIDDFVVASVFFYYLCFTQHLLLLSSRIMHLGVSFSIVGITLFVSFMLL